MAFPAIQSKSTQFISRQWVLHLVCAQCCLHAVISDMLSLSIQTLFLTTQLVTSFSLSLGMGYRQSHEALHLSSRRSGGRGRCHEEACRLNKLLLSLQSWVSSLHILLTHAKWETGAITTWLLQCNGNQAVKHCIMLISRKKRDWEQTWNHPVGLTGTLLPCASVSLLENDK